jgi:hypothetical protein
MLSADNSPDIGITAAKLCRWNKTFRRSTVTAKTLHTKNFTYPYDTFWYYVISQLKRVYLLHISLDFSGEMMRNMQQNSYCFRTLYVFTLTHLWSFYHNFEILSRTPHIVCLEIFSSWSWSEMNTCTYMLVYLLIYVCVFWGVFNRYFNRHV